ncbi:hypothetical protein Q9Q95_13125 [Sphingomonas sp. DG1-23]|uniref:hypothetical protein n=1 Tax=Sphingomonas sp. DG1-23 TaxID=3068316 RepID=UPI00273F663A|nr:hypothetical protein [Sphingomonas sp. DG1-23]MDP5279870.1 hypothetical protein [Sphingomonas sp. DG1-23]
MLGAAIRSEWYRTTRNRNLLFWAYGVIPLVYFALAATFDISMVLQNGSPKDSDNLRMIARVLNVAGNPVAHLFFAIGAASIVADDYRWETWRLIVPRNGRRSLIAGKFLTYLMLVGLALVLTVIGDRFVAVAAGIVRGQVDWPSAQAVGQASAVFFAAWFELGVLGAAVMFLAILTRSLLGAVIPAFLLSLTAAMGLDYLVPRRDAPWALLAPGRAGEVVREWILPPSGVPMIRTETAALAAISLFLWAVSALTLAILAFGRQDLSNE